jgi:hypothetical protein
MMLSQEESRVAEEKSVCKKFWEMESFLDDGGWQDLGRQSLEQVIEIGERLMKSGDFEIKKDVQSTVARYKSILESLSSRVPCND